MPKINKFSFSPYTARILSNAHQLYGQKPYGRLLFFLNTTHKQDIRKLAKYGKVCSRNCRSPCIYKYIQLTNYSYTYTHAFPCKAQCALVVMTCGDKERITNQCEIHTPTRAHMHIHTHTGNCYRTFTYTHTYTHNAAECV